MFDWLTADARRVHSAAVEHAQKLKHSAVGVEHLLLALTACGPPVAEALRALTITQADVLNQIEALTAAPAGVGGDGRRDPVPLSPGAIRARGLAWQEARRAGQNYLGPEHYLLGLIRHLDDPWAEPELAGEVLNRLGVELGRLRQEVLARIPTG